MKTKVNTVNVVVLINGVVESIIAFPDYPEGNKQAEAAFLRRVKKYEKENLLVTPSDAEDFENYVEDGIYDVWNGFSVLLVHSI